MRGWWPGVKKGTEKEKQCQSGNNTRKECIERGRRRVNTKGGEGGELSIPTKKDGVFSRFTGVHWTGKRHWRRALTSWVSRRTGREGRGYRHTKKMGTAKENVT